MPKMLSAYKISHSAVSVGTAATKLADANEARRVLRVRNNTTATVIYLGTSGVNQTNGYPLAAAAEFADAESIDVLYGMVASDTADTRVMEIA